MQSQKFTVIPDGRIKAGNLTYNLNPVTGDVSYAGEAKVQVLFFPITKSIAGSSKIDPQTLKSSHYNKPGAQLKLGDFMLTVISVASGKAICALEYPNCHGQGVLDISGSIVKIVSLDARGTVFGMELHLMLKAA